MDTQALVCSDIYAVGMIGISVLTDLDVSELQDDSETREILWRDLVSVSDGFGNVLTKMVKNYFPARYKNAKEALQSLGISPSTTIISSPSFSPSSPSLSPSFSLFQTLKGHTDAVYSVAISPDGHTIVSGSRDDIIKVWDLATGREKRTLKGHTSYVYSVAISLDGRTIGSGSLDDTIKIWDLATGKEKIILQGHTWEVYSVAISLDERTIVSGSDDETIKIWNRR